MSRPKTHLYKKTGTYFAGGWPWGKIHWTRKNGWWCLREAASADKNRNDP